MKHIPPTRRAFALSSLALAAFGLSSFATVTAAETPSNEAAKALDSRSPTPFEAYTTWQSGLKTPLRVIVVYGTDADEAARVGDVLAAPRFEVTRIARSALPTTDLKTVDLIVVADDTQVGEWTQPWGSDAEAKAIRDSDKPVLGISQGGLGVFGRLGLPVRSGKSARGKTDGIVVSQAAHAVFRSPAPLTPDKDTRLHLFTQDVLSHDAHRSSFTDAVIPLASEYNSQDYAPVLFQFPRATYFGFGRNFAHITPAGRSLFGNLALWTVWAARQTDPAWVRDGIVARKDPKRQGECIVDLTLMLSSGKPAANTAFTVAVDDAGRWPVLSRGVTDAAGRATIEHLTGGTDGERYKVDVEGMDVPALRIRLKSDSPRTALTGRIPPRIGEAAPSLPLVDIVTGAPARIEDYLGKVVFIDFWATWCGPCQKPMAHNSALTTAQKDAWTGRAVIIGISVDKNGDQLKNHVTSRKWTNLPQLWVPMKDGKPAADPSEVYGFNGIPTAFLIDQRGAVRWKGHPEGIDVAAKINELLEPGNNPKVVTLTEKLDAIVIPKVDFQELSVSDVVEFLRLRGKELDPDKTGVNLVLMDNENKAAVTFRMANVTLHTVLKTAAEQAGLVLDIGEEIVSLRKPIGNQAAPEQVAQPAAPVEEDVAFFEKKYQRKITGVKPKSEYSDPDEFYSAIGKQLGIPEIAWKAAAEKFGWKKDDGINTFTMLKGGPTAAGGQGTWDVMFIRSKINPETKKPDPATLQQVMVQIDYDGNITFPEIPQGKR